MAHLVARPADGWPVLRAAHAMGVTVGDDALAAVCGWLDLLSSWNAKLDLTAARSPEELVDLMLADALALAAHVPERARVVDVGTGAGAPGLALAILRPDLDVTLVEPLAKRAAFLRTAVGTLDRDVSILVTRGEAVSGTWDVALSRATLPPASWLALAAKLTRSGGEAWAFLAREEVPAHPALRPGPPLDYALPLTGAARRLVRYLRAAPDGAD